MSDHKADQMAMMIRGYWVSQIVGAVARLGISDRLASGAMRFDELAQEIGCNSESTYRLLRAAASIGLMSPVAGDRFGLSPMGALLRSNVPGSMRDLAMALTAPGHWLPWGRLTEAVRLGERQTPDTLGSELFQYYAKNPDEGGIFTMAMANVSALVADEVAKVLDTSTATHVVDVGGASGAIIAALLDKNPSLQGTILDLPQVAPLAREAIAGRKLSSRCTVVEGDFFEMVPEADIHVLKRVIHDWSDAQSRQILSNCARALRPRGRVVLIETVLPDDGRPSDAPLMDLNMLVLLPGRERTTRQYRELLQAAGLHLDRVIETASPMQILEASAAGSC